jgi:hypothetical protein
MPHVLIESPTFRKRCMTSSRYPINWAKNLFTDHRKTHMALLASSKFTHRLQHHRSLLQVCTHISQIFHNIRGWFLWVPLSDRTLPSREKHLCSGEHQSRGLPHLHTVVSSSRPSGDYGIVTQTYDKFPFHTLEGASSPSSVRIRPSNILFVSDAIITGR